MGFFYNTQAELLREPNLLIPGKKPVGPVKVDRTVLLGDVDHMWPSTQPTGKTLRDIAGGKDLTINNATRNPNGSFAFDGSGDYIIGGEDSLNLGGLTTISYGGWFTPSYSKVNYVAGVQDSSESLRYVMAIAQYTSGNELRVFWTNSSNDDNARRYDRTKFPSGEYCHIVVTYDFTSSPVYFVVFRNGLYVAPDEYVETSGVGGLRSGGKWSLGRDQGSTARDYSGTLDDWRVYKRTLSVEEVLAWYKDSYQMIIPA